MLILASASPRRHELLLAAGIEHQVRPVYIPEDRLPGELAQDFVKRIAELKNRALSAGPGDIVLSADTAVSVQGQVFGKPSDQAEARRMLSLLSGVDHWVYTGFCLRKDEQVLVDVSATRVTFASLSPAEIETYVACGEAYDKAGAYAIQGLASKFIACIEGSYHNVVGLPVSLVYEHLKAFWGNA